ncbi:MAG: hypothetical protein MI673_01650, partial [Thiotrichales bacterium]|nr:hypothetical protein [Thiotrichales bacterium]
MNEAVKKKNIWMVVFIFVLFLMPLIASWWFMNFSDVTERSSKSNYGTLIRPAVPLPELTVQESSNKERRSLRGKWTLLYIVTGKCAEDCRRILFSLDQIEKALGKDSLRVQRAVLSLPPEINQAVFANYPQLWQ